MKLESFSDNNPISHRCSASIIDENVLLTSAQCVSNLPRNSQLIIVAGIKNLMAYNSADIQIRYPTEIIKHSDEFLTIDLAVIILKTPLNFSNTVQPINLPKKNLLATTNEAFQFGWSVHSRESEYFSELLMSDRIIKENGSCGEIKDQLSSFQICAVTPICNTGDHGSPLVVFNEFGIVSFLNQLF